MTIANVASLSSKGQIVIPNNIRRLLHLKTGTKLTIMSDGNNILLHPIDVPKISEFQSLINESKNFINDNKVSKKKLNSIIKQVRSENRS